MDLRLLGWNSDLQTHFSELSFENCIPARIAEESRDFYKIFTEHGTLLASVTGRIRFRAEERSDFPAVGDWVAIVPRLAERRATIVSILPRNTVLSRKMAGRDFQEQIIATNIDILFLVSSLNLEFNLRRLERYLAIAWQSGSQPVVLLNKADLCADPSELQQQVEEIAPTVPVNVISGLTGAGLADVKQYLSQSKTAAFIGSSGVGKSTIINALSGSKKQLVKSIRESDDHGKHATTSRQMIVLPGGGSVIDTPGMREIGMWESEAGLSNAFYDIEELALQCRFRDCRHRGEPSCAVNMAIQNGKLSIERLENYQKLEAELRFTRRKSDVHLQRAAKAEAKRVGRAIKRIYKDREGE